MTYTKEIAESGNQNSVTDAGVGAEMANLITNRFTTIESLINADQKDLLDISSVGPKIATNLITYFENQSNKRVISKLCNSGI